MCNDIKKMDCESDKAKEIIAINNQLFYLMFETVGDTISYNGLNTLQHVHKYIENSLKGQEEAQNNPEHSSEWRDMLVRDYASFNNFSYLLNEAIIICNEQKLQEQLPIKSLNTIKKKI